MNNASPASSCRNNTSLRCRWSLSMINAATTVLITVVIVAHDVVALPRNINGHFTAVTRNPQLPFLFPSKQTTSSSQFLSGPRRKNSLISYYAEEWEDAGVEMALNRSVNRSLQQSSLSKPTFKRLLSRIPQCLHRLREAVRLLFERSTVYVLECQNGKYYVGSTNNRKRRFKEHKSAKGGSKWTKEHKPIRILREYRRVPSKYLLGFESRVTAECMLEFGVNNVRGSMFCNVRDYHMGDIDSLTIFLGHYNSLSYRKVRSRLARALPNPKGRQIDKRSRSYHLPRVRCYNCGKMGHYAADCPGKTSRIDEVI